MTNSKKIGGLILSVAVLAGCAMFDQTILVPEEKGVYHAIALDSSDFGAQRSALKRADKTCSAQQMRYIVDKQQTLYQGMEDNTDRTSSAAQQSAKKTAEDYKSIVTFHCAVG